MKEATRNIVWTQDKKTCQLCGEKLTKIVDPLVSYEERIANVKKGLKSLNEIRIYKWSHACWKCQKDTPLVSYDFQFGFDYSIGNISKLDEKLKQKYPFVKRIYSKTMEEEVIANVCIHCGSLQGNFFIGQELFDMKVEEREMEKTVDTILSINFSLEDLDLNEEPPSREPYELRDTSLAHIHHIDGDRENNALGNLILYCVTCHMKIHHSNEYPHLKPEYIRSKKKSQIKKEPEPIEIPETVLVDMISKTLSELGGSVGILLLSQKTKIEVKKLITLSRKYSSIFHLDDRGQSVTLTSFLQELEDNGYFTRKNDR